MGKIINLRKQLISLVIPILMIMSVVFIVKSPVFDMNAAALSFGITFDLLLTIPFIYFLLIRSTGIPKITVVTFFVAGIVVATFVLPVHHQYFLQLAKTWLLPVVEISVLILVGFKVRKAVKHYEKNKDLSPDFFTALKSACREILPNKVVMPFATEIAVFYYGFFCWKKLVLKENEFTCHKNSGIMALLIAILCIIAIETCVLHLLLLQWSETAAWIMTLLSIYSGIQLFGFLKSITQRPITIEKDKLNLRYGILSETVINIEDIEEIDLTTKAVEPDEATKKLSPFGDFENHNVVIKLNKENTLNGLYGMKKKFKTLLLHVDDREEFKRRIVDVL